MITIFNRKELVITYSLKEQAEIRDILVAHDIDYIVNVIDLLSPTPFPVADVRKDFGSLGQNTNSSKEYKIFVHKNDYEKGKTLLSK